MVDGGRARLETGSTPEPSNRGGALGSARLLGRSGPCDRASQEHLHEANSPAFSLVPDDERAVEEGIPVTSVHRTIFDLAATVSIDDMIAMIKEAEYGRLPPIFEPS